MDGEKVAISNLVKSLEGVSSRLLRKKRPDTIVRQYIEQQQTPH